MTRPVLRTVLLALAGSAGLALAPASLAQSTFQEEVTAAIARGDADAALALVLPRVEAGEAEAQLAYGSMLLNGTGLPQDDAAAMDQFRAAAEQGLGAAMNEYGRGLTIGRGRPADLPAGLEWLSRAAASGDASMAHDYAVALEAYGGESRLGEALDWYRRAAEQDFAPSVTSLGVLYLDGRGVEADPGRAFNLFRRAAEAGDGRAQNNLGLMYSRGTGVERDYEAAVVWFERAAAQGLPQALRNLSVLYENGFGVDLDEAFAVELLRQARALEGESFRDLLLRTGFPVDPRLVRPDWTQAVSASEVQAAQAGDIVALYLTGLRYLGGFGVQLDAPEGVRRLERAARGGLGSAALNLGLLHARGQFVPQNYRTAYFWFSHAALLGVAGAAELRDALALEMSRESLQQAQRDVQEFQRSLQQ
ncbi:tetratricopeptide repeat protein [Maricaulis sp.]|uniref:tetratricopeptide repeat protein n=1 Tax=Maricaulis sp. TaxID=1486257 RepID=UPI0026157787|nr:tetratricopeptide repeat protein [Maricaulis sp.]